MTELFLSLTRAKTYAEPLNEKCWQLNLANENFKLPTEEHICRPQ